LIEELSNVTSARDEGASRASKFSWEW